jgi:hypothetical protein
LAKKIIKYTELEYDPLVKSQRNLITGVQNQIRNKKEMKGNEIEELTITKTSDPL